MKITLTPEEIKDVIKSQYGLHVDFELDILNSKPEENNSPPEKPLKELALIDGYYAQGSKGYHLADGKFIAEEMPKKFTGVYQSWHEKNALRVYIEYKNGKEHGLLIKWYRNGQPAVEEHYDNGKKDGKSFYWYDSGQLDYAENYKAGFLINTPEY